MSSDEARNAICLDCKRMCSCVKLCDGYVCVDCTVKRLAGQQAECDLLRRENLSLYRVLTKLSPVSPEVQRLQKLLEGVCVPGSCILTAAADEIERLRHVAHSWLVEDIGRQVQ